LLDQISKINEEQRRLRALKMQIRGYVELSRNKSDDSVQLAELYSNLVNKIGSATMSSAGVVEAIVSATKASHELMEKD
jgi:hypothetical protein